MKKRFVLMAALICGISFSASAQFKIGGKKINVPQIRNL